MVRKLGMMIMVVIMVQFVFNTSFAQASVFDTKISEVKTVVSPNVTHIKRNYQSGSIKEAVHVLDVNLQDTYTSLEIGFPKPLKSLKTTSSLAKEYSYEGHRVVGAVNAAYFLGTGAPANLLAQNNEIINYGILGVSTESPTQKPVAFGISKTGKAIADYYTTDLSFTVDGKKYALDSIDNVRSKDMNVLYTPDMASTGTNEWGLEIVVTNASQDTKTLHFGDSFTGIVSSVAKYGTKGNASVPSDGFVISVQNQTVATEIQNAIEEGSEIEVNLAIDQKWMDAEFILAAGPLLVKDNKVNISMSTSTSFAKTRAPRTAVAVDATGSRVFLVTVDGRQSGYSTGTSLMDLASYLISLGASAAINLDGGGSTTMVTRAPGGYYPTLVNKPSDGSERRVSAILQVVNSAPLGNIKAIKLSNNGSEVEIGSSLDMKISSAYDEYLNPVAINPADMNWTVQGNIGTMNGATFVAEKSGTGKIIGEYEGVKAEISITVAAKSGSYKDVNSSHWAYESIENLNKSGLIKGFTDGTFRPEATISRAEVAVIIARALNLQATTTPNFSDVKSSSYAYSGIAAVSEAGIITGREPGKFDPDGKLTRAEMASILTRAYNLQGTGNVQYTDINANHWAYSYVQTLVANNLVAGYVDNTFRPNEKVSRAQFAAFIDRVNK
ncbi:S-layer homology domain-containing protein [Lysinibacillus antri]|uniref:SLH domain-containing protein n=1 Tax=Lysinibacillus antri TaxID=2498145 RepID=A0A432L9X2_9BACI|nr:S-layer homology domain-containing protein [Lysinibacillus antri]RUL49821.1 hypothetical protein EK386_14795 [Lysinibacillus antri]